MKSTEHLLACLQQVLIMHDASKHMQFNGITSTICWVDETAPPINSAWLLRQICWFEPMYTPPWLTYVNLVYLVTS